MSKALYEMTEEEYLKHLEQELLDGEDYKRCYMCNRVESLEYMVEVLESDEYVCECCKKAFDGLPDYELEREKEYQWAKK